MPVNGSHSLIVKMPAYQNTTRVQVPEGVVVNTNNVKTFQSEDFRRDFEADVLQGSCSKFCNEEGEQPTAPPAEPEMPAKEVADSA